MCFFVKIPSVAKGKSLRGTGKLTKGFGSEYMKLNGCNLSIIHTIWQFQCNYSRLKYTNCEVLNKLI